MKFLVLLSALVAAIASPLEIRQSSFAGQNLRILPLGASITNGVGSTTGNGYRENLRNLLSNTQVTYVGSQCSGSMSNGNNEGHSGSVIADQTGYASQDISAKPNVILVLVGTNDAAQDKISGAADRYRNLVQYLSSNFPGALIVASKLFPDGDPTVAARIRTLNSQLNVAGIGNVVVADFSQALTPADLVDGRHPTDAGYVKVAQVFYNTLIANAGRIPAVSGTYNGPYCHGAPPIVQIAAPVQPTTTVRAQAAVEVPTTTSSIAVQITSVMPIPISSSTVSRVPVISTAITSSTSTTISRSTSTTVSTSSIASTSGTTSTTRSSASSSPTTATSTSRSSTTSARGTTTTTSVRLSSTTSARVVSQISDGQIQAAGSTTARATSTTTGSALVVTRASTTTSATATARPSIVTGSASVSSSSFGSMAIALLMMALIG